jgi:hypothetical protein
MLISLNKTVLFVGMIHEMERGQHEQGVLDLGGERAK